MPMADPLPVIVNLGDSHRVTASERYYVHVVATLGMLADQEVDAAGDAVFGTGVGNQRSRLAWPSGVPDRLASERLPAERHGRGQEPAALRAGRVEGRPLGRIKRSIPYLPITFSVTRSVDASARLAGAAPGGRSASSNVAIASIREPRGRAIERSNQ